MEEYLVIDIGTSSARVLVMDGAGAVLRSMARKRVLPALFDPEEEWRGVAELIRALTGQAPCAPRAVAVSALLGWVGVDGDGRACTPCFSYMHQCAPAFARAQPALERLDVYARTGRRPNPELGIFQLLQLRLDDPARYRRTAALLSLKDYVNLRLTGVTAMDATTACYTLAYDQIAGGWSAPILDALGADGDRLPPLRAPWQALAPLAPGPAGELGLPPGIPVAVGSVDGSTGILGAGGVDSGTLVSVMGTTDTTFLVCDAPLADPTGALVRNPHVIPGRWLLGGPMGMYGGTADWLTARLLGGSATPQSLTRLAAQVPPGSGGVSFFPCLAGERTPFWQSAMRGTALGLGPEHGPEHLFRALLEANAYAVRRLADLAQAAGAQAERAIAIGGGCRNDLWLSIKAAVLGVPQVRTRVEEATAAGSAMLAMLCSGTPPEELPRPAAARTFPPEEEARAAYQGLYQDYLALHHRVAALY